GVKIQVSGYADPRGSAQYNAALSKERAESVAAVLTHAGLPEDRLVIAALGANGATVTGNPDDYAFQRRVSVKLMGVQSPDEDKSAQTVAQVQ
ncbi:MAG TPA: OmpA family protein, partial [Acetobacteraceae bacterium]|nr:OmpA family protein [Acetobacteraceae bacterium]